MAVPRITEPFEAHSYAVDAFGLLTPPALSGWLQEAAGRHADNLGVGMDKPKPDLGRFEQSKAEGEKGAFKTPTLRNIAQTAPYMHDGSEATLRAVVAFYNKGGVANSWLSKEIKPLNLSAAQVDDLVAFLEALSGDVNNAEPPAKLP